MLLGCIGCLLLYILSCFGCTLVMRFELLFSHCKIFLGTYVVCLVCNDFDLLLLLVSNNNKHQPCAVAAS